MLIPIEKHLLLALVTNIVIITGINRNARYVYKYITFKFQLLLQLPYQFVLMCADQFNSSVQPQMSVHMYKIVRCTEIIWEHVIHSVLISDLAASITNAV